MALDDVLDAGLLLKRVDVLRVVPQQLPLTLQHADEPADGSLLMARWRSHCLFIYLIVFAQVQLQDFRTIVQKQSIIIPQVHNKATQCGPHQGIIISHEDKTAKAEGQSICGI